MKSFEDKIVVITGAGSGIGRALALQLIAEKAVLVLLDKDLEGLEETKRLAGNDFFEQIHLRETDISSKEKVYEIAEWVINTFQRVDVVINNAGVALDRLSIAEVSYEEMEWIFSINFWGVVYGTKAYLPQMLKQNSGYIVNISSLFGLVGVSDNGAYCATKFAVRGFTESLRAELMDIGVTAMSVHPGGILTNIVRNARSRRDSSSEEVQKDIKRVERLFKTSPEDAAKKIIWGIKKGKGRLLIGKDARQADRIIRLFPERAIKIFYKLSSGIRQKSTPKT